MKYVLALIIALILNAGANLLMKVGMKAVAASGGLFKSGPVAAVETVLTNVTLMIGLMCFALNAMFYMYALQSKALQISVAYPIMVGGGYALIAVIAHFHPLLSESMTWGQKLGVSLILLGVVLIASQTQMSPAGN